MLFSKQIKVSLKKATFPKKVVLAEQELDGTDIDDIGNLENSPRLFIDEECGNLIVVNYDRELSRNINQNNNSDILQKPIVVGENIS